MTTSPETATAPLTCCDGTGWTGHPNVRCTDHYEPLDPIWFS